MRHSLLGVGIVQKSPPENCLFLLIPGTSICSLGQWAFLKLVYVLRGKLNETRIRAKFEGRANGEGSAL